MSVYMGPGAEVVIDAVLLALATWVALEVWLAITVWFIPAVWLAVAVTLPEATGEVELALKPPVIVDPDPEVVAEAVADPVPEVDAPAVRLYIAILHPAPQDCELSPGHGIAQSLSANRSPPLPVYSLPQ
jgi:hypothetical protein